MSVVFFAVISAWIGKLLLKRWFNPLTVYSVAWGACLLLYELGLIQFYRISFTAWFFIFAAWGCFILGTVTSWLLFSPGRIALESDPDLRRAIIWLTVFGSVGVADQARTITREFGTLAAIFISAGDIYEFRTSSADTSLPYAGAAFFAASALAGIHLAKVGKIGVGIFPLFMLAVTGLFALGRSGIAVGIFLFLACYLLSRSKATAMSRKTIILYATVALLLLAPIKIISDLRGTGVVAYPGETDAFERFNERAPMLAGLSANIAATPVAFSMYLGMPEPAKHGMWGAYTFAPIYRLLSRFGFNTHVAGYEENYDTPVPVNISTYLKNVHSDFGPSGVFLFPFLLAFCATALTLRPGPLVSRLILAHLYAVITFSVLFNIMLLGYWYLSLTVSIMTGIVAGRRIRRHLPYTARTPALEGP